MLFSLFALGALAFFDLATTSVAGHARFHHVQPRHRRISTFREDQRASSRRSIIDGRDTSSVQVTMGDLQLLQQESTAFAGWMNSWFDSAQTVGPEIAASQLRQQLTAYQGWINAWLDSAMNSSAAPSIPSPVPVTSQHGASVSLALPTTLVTPIAAKTSSVAAPLSTSTTKESHAASSSAANPSSSTTSVSAGQFFQKPESHFSTTSTSTTSSSTSIVIQEPTGVPVVNTPAAPSLKPTTTAADPAPSAQSSSGGYSFNADSSSNLAVYYGQTEATAQISLADMCGDEHVDIVILAFLTNFFGPAGYPSINLGSACGGQTNKMNAMGATGLQSCPTLAADIKTCQSMGKKVLLSLGGALATTAFSGGDDQASKFATTLWDLFGAGTGVDAGLRPFGDVKLDGFDVDNEDHSTAHYNTFVSALRKTMDTDSSRKYYISAAPQCPRPDASIPLEAMQTMDFVFVQFYNNGDCNIGQPGFEASFKAWSQDLSAKGKGPKLYIGAPGCTACAGSGYVSPGQVDSVMSAAKSAGVSNFGGVMLWDGPMAKVNLDGGKDYLSVVKGAMGS